MVKRNVIQCTVEGCETIEYAKGLCSLHYRRKLSTGSVELQPRKRRRPKICTVEDCDRPHQAKGYCVKHYHVFKRDNLPPLPPKVQEGNHGRLHFPKLTPLPTDHPMWAALALPTELDRVNALLSLKAGT